MPILTSTATSIPTVTKRVGVSFTLTTFVTDVLQWSSGQQAGTDFHRENFLAALTFKNTVFNCLLHF